MKHPKYQKDGPAANSFTRVRAEVLEAYGGKCFLCGEADPQVLTFTKLERNGFQGTFYFLRAHGYPKDRQVVCANCDHRTKKYPLDFPEKS